MRLRYFCKTIYINCLLTMNTTIAAVSTAYGESGIGIVRVSGPDAGSIISKVFRGKTDPVSHPRYMCHGVIIDPESGRELDEVLCVFMKAPHTYTAEDLAEIQCHGSSVSIKNILSLCFRMGAEPAERGEFTKRAFLNGRIDLSQAEAVIDLIKARSSRSFDVAMDQMNGGLSSRVSEVRNVLKELLVSLTVNMDYPDEDIEEITYANIESAVLQASSMIEKLLAGAGEGRILRDGLGVAIVGKPNVGKSSLMNYFLSEERSIVTSVPGTTRDTIEESAVIRGIPLRFTDTAGIHEAGDEVEAIGIERSKKAFNEADLLLLLIDSSEALSDEDYEIASYAKGRPCIAVLNKQDIGGAVGREDVERLLPGVRVCEISAASGEGIEGLEDAIEEFIGSGRVRRENDLLVSNARHEQLLRKAQSELGEALSITRAMEAIDFIEINVKAAFDYLGDISGETASDEIIEEIFSRFCLGK